MTLPGTVLLALIGLALVLWVLSLVRRDRLYVGYASILIALIVTATAVISIAPLLTLINRWVGAVFPVSALALLTLCFIAVTLIYVLSQLTMVSNRLAVAIQELAIQRATARSPRPSDSNEPGGVGFREP